jgi:glycosyltransferase involved in cell wall biosynthesis
MKILYVHNYYQSSAPSGENVVFKNEMDLLRENRVEVVTYTQHNDEILNYGLFNKLKLFFRNIWSFKTYKDLKTLIKKERPDICHIHNIFYLISPSAYYACKKFGIPVVQTLHNYRFFCANGLLFRNNKPCDECIGEIPFKGFLYGCYKNSRIYSLAITLMEIIHKMNGTLNKYIDGFIALTDFAKRNYVRAGLLKERVFIKPNFLLNDPKPEHKANHYMIFIGRLSPGKGLLTLLKAWGISDISNIRLKIIGSSADMDLFRNIVIDLKLKNVELLGQKPHEEVIRDLKNALFLVFPSEWYEGFPMTIVEAFACGKPVIASNLGAMAELVEDRKTGILFEAGNPEDLANKMKWMIENEDACIEMGKNARKVFEEKYTAEKNFEILMKIYNQLIAHRL